MHSASNRSEGGLEIACTPDLIMYKLSSWRLKDPIRRRETKQYNLERGTTLVHSNLNFFLEMVIQPKFKPLNKPISFIRMDHYVWPRAVKI